MSTREQLDQHGDDLKKYFAAIKEVKTGLINADPNFDEAVKTLRSKYDFAALADDDIANQSLPDRCDAWKDDETGDVGEPSVDSIERAYKELSYAGIVPTGKNVEDLIDTSLLP